MATIDEIRNLSEPLKGYQFKIIIADPPGAGASSDILQFRCTATVLPGKDIEETLVNLGGYNVKYAGRSIPTGLWSTTFIEGTDLSVVERLFTWGEIAHDMRTGVNGESSDYKRVARVELLNNAKETVKVRRVIGIWPQSVPDLAFDSASSDASRYDVTWAYDFFQDE